jgi:hypothetical protein
MSAETYANVERALHDHVMSETDGYAELVRDWVVVCATTSMDDDGDTAEILVYRGHQTALYSVTGLLEWGKQAYSEVD